MPTIDSALINAGKGVPKVIPHTWYNASNVITAMAPMVGQSDPAFRLLCRKYGTSLCYSEMLLADRFHSDVGYRRRAFGNGIRENDHPLVVQFAANNATDFVSAALEAQALGADGVDLNLGCPQERAREFHYGSYLTDVEEWNLCAEIIRAASNHPDINIPITVKIRLQPSIDATCEFAALLARAGASIVAIHGRQRGTSDRRRDGSADLNAIACVVAALLPMNVPVLSNGNVRAFSDVQDNLRTTRAAGIMVAEQLLRDPALFARGDVRACCCVNMNGRCSPMCGNNRVVDCGVGAQNDNTALHVGFNVSRVLPDIIPRVRIFCVSKCSRKCYCSAKMETCPERNVLESACSESVLADDSKISTTRSSSRGCICICTRDRAYTCTLCETPETSDLCGSICSTEGYSDPCGAYTHDRSTDIGVVALAEEYITLVEQIDSIVPMVDGAFGKAGEMKQTRRAFFNEQLSSQTSQRDTNGNNRTNVCKSSKGDVHFLPASDGQDELNSNEKSDITVSALSPATGDNDITNEIAESATLIYGDEMEVERYSVWWSNTETVKGHLKNQLGRKGELVARKTFRNATTVALTLKCFRGRFSIKPKHDCVQIEPPKDDCIR
eukprot:CFRG7350T1